MSNDNTAHYSEAVRSIAERALLKAEDALAYMRGVHGEDSATLRHRVRRAKDVLIRASLTTDSTEWLRYVAWPNALA